MYGICGNVSSAQPQNESVNLWGFGFTVEYALYFIYQNAAVPNETAFPLATNLFHVVQCLVDFVPLEMGGMKRTLRTPTFCPFALSSSTISFMVPIIETHCYQYEGSIFNFMRYR